MDNQLPFRKNVAVFVVRDKLILTCQRTRNGDAGGEPNWQLPQGGIDGDESPEETLRRELREEIHLQSFTVLLKLPFTVSYLWPKELHHRGYAGQEQYFFVVSPAKDGWHPIFDSHAEVEFKDYQWLNASEFTNLVKDTFRAESYLKALQFILDNHKDLII